MLEALKESLYAFINKPYRPRRRFFFEKYFYNPFMGVSAKVDNPVIPINTNWVVTPDVSILNGRLEKHFINDPTYKQVYMNRKMNAMLNCSRIGQIDKYSKGYNKYPCTGVFGNGMMVHSFKPRDYFKNNFAEAAIGCK
jgi:hypothetical protein